MNLSAKILLFFRVVVVKVKMSINLSLKNKDDQRKE
jgi:hypothetical protein